MMNQTLEHTPEDLQTLARQRALEKLTAQEMQTMRDEKIAHDAKEQDEWRKFEMAQAEAENHAVNELEKLGALYVQRSEIAQRVSDAIAEYLKLESVIGEANSRARGEVQEFWQRSVAPNLQGRRFAEMRVRAGLHESHTHLFLPRPTSAGAMVAAVCLLGILKGIIAPSGIRVATKFIPFDFSNSGEI